MKGTLTLLDMLASIKSITMVTEFVFILTLTIGFCSGVDNTCKKAEGSYCKCSTGDGVTIDLKDITKFTDIPDPKSTAVYSYQPCSPFTEGTGCQNVAACQSDGGATRSLGTQDSVAFIGDPKTGLNLTYTATDATKYTRQAVIQLICDKDKKVASLEMLGEVVINITSFSQYVFRLNTTAACPSSPSGGGGGLSPGSVLLIIFFVLLFVYFVGGILLLRFWQGARGVEQIPQYEFWKELPLLIKDGVTFTMSGCKTDTAYEKI